MAFNIMDQGVLTIGNRGEILYGNKPSFQLLGINEGNVQNYNIRHFLLEDSSLLKAIALGHDVSLEACFLL
jgi:transcriptional regulator with PAS, ATPase and Fis domain